MKARTVLLLCALVAGVAACGGTETGNPGSAQVALGIRASEPAVVSVGPGGTGHHVEALFLAVDEAALTACDAAGEDVIFAKNITIDLVAGAMETHDVPPGRYCGFRVTLASHGPLGGDGAPAVPDATIAVQGERADGVPFTVASRSALVIAASSEPFDVRAGDELVLAFDVSEWLGAGILETAPVVEGRAVIDGTGNSATQFEQQLTAGLHRDINRDGTVDPGETTPLAGVEPPPPE